ncbi:MAG: sugar-binding protein [Eubacteriales bacterium]
MKKILAIMLAVVFITAIAAMPVVATDYWNDSIRFKSAYGTPTIDGKVDAGEWDSASAINMALNNDPVAASGNVNYQGAWEGDRNDADYSGSYTIMYDEKNLYILEQRKDDVVNLNGNGVEPYLTDGVLVFTQAVGSGTEKNPEGYSHHIFYSVGKDGAIGGDVMVRICNIDAGTRETVAIEGASIKSAIVDGGYVVEIAVPWSMYTKQIPEFKGPAAGDVFGLSFVVHDSDDTAATGFVKQFCYAIDNDMLANVPGGYDFGGWGTLEMLAKPAPAATDAPVADTDAPTAPVTGDTAVVLAVILAIASAVGFAVVKKSRV